MNLKKNLATAFTLAVLAQAPLCRNASSLPPAVPALLLDVVEASSLLISIEGTPGHWLVMLAGTESFSCVAGPRLDRQAAALGWHPSEALLFGTAARDSLREVLAPPVAVMLEFGPVASRREGVLEAYVWTSPRALLNEAVVRSGIATLVVGDNMLYFDQLLLRAHIDAFDGRRGVWGSSLQRQVRIGSGVLPETRPTLSAEKEGRKGRARFAPQRRNIIETRR